jgi:hypothetical protein
MATYSARRQFQDVNSNILTATAVSLNPGATTTGTTSTATATVTGANVGDYVEVSCQTALGNVQIGGEVTAANTVTVKFSNTTAGSITPAGGAALYNIVVYQRDPKLFV